MQVRKAFETELSELNAQLVEMCRVTEGMISNAIEALINRDKELGKSIGELDKQVDEYEMSIEKKCMRILLRQQPVASDFRKVSTALKMITDIERFGDQASDIGELVASMPTVDYVKRLKHISLMGNLAIKMVRDSVSSFITNNQELASSVIIADDTMDSLFKKVQRELIELIKQDSNSGEEAITLMMIAKYLERIGDHAVNVAEWTQFNETGKHKKF
ncbi:MAG: phosphate signaling complex protein PhoU [Clostridia bacterium]|nr:phosphate signaling complex protein PhoU [Clostridia bacterium]